MINISLFSSLQLNILKVQGKFLATIQIAFANAANVSQTNPTAISKQPYAPNHSLEIIYICYSRYAVMMIFF